MKRKAGFLQILGVLIVAIAVLKIYGNITGNSGNLDLYTVGMFIIPVAVALIMRKLLSMGYDFEWRDRGLSKKTAFAFIYIVFVGIAFVLINFMSIPSGALGSPKPETILFLAASCIMTGIFEETVFRGIIQNMVAEISDTPIRAVVISSAIFGIVHILNLIAAPQMVIGTLTQVIYTFSLGMILGVIYMCRGKIIEVILLHAIFNFMGQFTAVFLSSAPSSAPKSDLTLTAALIQLAFMLPCIWIAVRTYRKNISIQK